MVSWIQGAHSVLARIVMSRSPRASGAAGSSQNSRRVTLTAAPGYARRWCTITSRNFSIKCPSSPRREQPRRVLRGCDSPFGIPFQILFCVPPKCVIRNYLIINKKSVVLWETPRIFIKHSVSAVRSSRSRDVVSGCMLGCMFNLWYIARE